MAILKEIQKKLYINTKRKSLSVLDGAYKAVYHSRSVDYEDLREYVPGDNAKDIAWKATAKSPKLLVKRSIADKQFPVLFVVDAGLNMNALSVDGETNRFEITEAIIAALGQVVLNHHDTLGCLMGDASSTNRLPFKSTTTHLESILKTLRTNFAADKVQPSNIVKQLELVMQLKTMRSVIVVISDNNFADEQRKQALQKLISKHDVIWVTVKDANPFQLYKTEPVEDIETGMNIPDFLRTNKKLAKFYQNTQQHRNEETEQFLRTHKVSYIEIATVEQVIPQLTAMLQRRANER